MNEKKLIELVRSHEELYNTNLSGYRNVQTRTAAWADVSKQYGRTPEECIEAWRKLRNCYTNAKKRRKRKSSANLGRWKYGDEMSFLDPYLKEGPCFDDLELMFGENSCETSPDSNTSTSISTSSKTGTAYERELFLIDLVRRYEHLYNANCKEYTDLKERYVAWSEIADLHGSTVKYCKETWMRLRNCYGNALCRREKNKSKKWTNSPWRFEKEMSFLRPYLQRRSVNTENKETIVNEEDSEGTIIQISTNDDSLDLTVSPSITSNLIPRKRKATKDYSESINKENTTDLMYTNYEFDDVDHFFLSMSKMIKKLPQVEQFRIKLDLHKTINEAVLKHEKIDSSKNETSVEVKLENLNPDYTYEILEDFSADDNIECSNYRTTQTSE